MKYKYTQSDLRDYHSDKYTSRQRNTLSLARHTYITFTHTVCVCVCVCVCVVIQHKQYVLYASLHDMCSII